MIPAKQKEASAEQRPGEGWKACPSRPRPAPVLLPPTTKQGLGRTQPQNGCESGSWVHRSRVYLGGRGVASVSFRKMGIISCLGVVSAMCYFSFFFFLNNCELGDSHGKV